MEKNAEEKSRNKGGRPKGSTNFPRARLYARIQRDYPNWDPVLHMVGMANDESLPAIERLAAAKEVAQYIYPKLRAVEVTGEGGGPVTQQVELVFVRSTRPAIEQLEG